MTDAADPFAGIRARFSERLIEDRRVLAEVPTEGLTGAEIVSRVHRLAGLAGTLGYPQLSSCAKRLESAIVHESFDALQVDLFRETLLSQVDVILQVTADQR
jgi:HPt (histidine-containing phosphotransfer) domain-containing protein